MPMCVAMRACLLILQICLIFFFLFVKGETLHISFFVTVMFVFVVSQEMYESVKRIERICQNYAFIRYSNAEMCEQTSK